MPLDRKITILYGSETGTSQSIAEHMWRLSRRFSFTGFVLPMDEYLVENLISERFVVFICSTTGVGEEPYNMKKFWKFLLRKTLPVTSLMHLNFGVLGLGDSSYSKFNFVAKRLHKRLIQLGANAIVDLGLCDYQHDLGNDAVSEPWIKSFWTKISAFFPNIDIDTVGQFVFINRWKLTQVKCEHYAQNNIENHSNDMFHRDFTNIPKQDIKLQLTKNEKITSEDHFQDVRILRFDTIDERRLNYSPGDVFNVRPKNSHEVVLKLFAFFKCCDIDIDLGDKLRVEELDSDMPVPYFLKKPLSLYEIAEQYWDLNAVPTKYAFSILGHVSSDKLEKEKCLEFCTPEGYEDYLNYCYRPKRTILETLEDFHRSASNLTINELFEMFTPIKPRSFSIASSCKVLDNNAVELLVAVVQFKTLMKKERVGLCSNWLKNLSLGEIVYGWIKKGTFFFPGDYTTPIIMIGPGTGVAPFHSLISERNLLDVAKSDTLVLFFGCRNEKHDFHYKDEFKILTKENKLNLICAFSRDQDDKIYVQHKIAEHKKLLWSYVSKNNAFIYIAGNAKNMPDNVKESIIENVLQDEGLMSNEEAKKYLKQMENLRRLQLETW